MTGLPNYTAPGPTTVPATVRRPVNTPDLPGFRTIPLNERIRPDDLKMVDGTPMIGPDGFLIPPARSFSMIVNAAQRVYSYRFDEAMRDNFVNARAMLRDSFIWSLLQERWLPTTNRKWQLEVDDSRAPVQTMVRDALTKLVGNVTDFDMFRQALLMGSWFGRAGCGWNYRRDPDADGLWGPGKWDPVHGDSVQFTFDGHPAILMDSATAGWYTARGATRGPFGDVRSTDRGGMALVLQRPLWRDRYAIYQHTRMKADFFEGELAGSVQGFGLRGMVYWHYVIRTDALTWMLTYMQAVGQMDLLIFNYPWSDTAAKAAAEANAQKIIGKAALAVPRNPQGTWAAVEQIPMNSEGLKALHDLVSDYFDRHIERLIVGQSMSAGADKENGLGGTGRADFAKQTKDEIIIYDTNRVDAVLTRDLIAPLKKYNFAWAKFPVRFKSILPNLDADKKVAAGQTMISTGVAIKVDEYREASGYSRPEPGDEVVGGPQTAGTGQPPGATPNSPLHVNAPGLGPNGQVPAVGTPNPQPPGGPGPFGAPAPPIPLSALALPAHPAAPTPAAAPVRFDGGPPAGGPAMGFPGGGNTYIPGTDRRPDPVVGFTRFSGCFRSRGGAERRLLNGVEVYGGTPDWDAAAAHGTYYEVKHAPPGGVTIGGQKFTGGQFIPADVMDNATPDERAAVEGGASHGGTSVAPDRRPLPTRDEWLGELRNIYSGLSPQVRKLVPGPESGDLSGLCGWASAALQKRLAAAGVPTTLVRGGHGPASRPGAVPSSESHVWLVTGDGTVVDGTASQLGGGAAPGDIGVYPPGSPEAAAYVPENTQQPTTTPAVPLAPDPAAWADSIAAAVGAAPGADPEQQQYRAAVVRRVLAGLPAPVTARLMAGRLTGVVAHADKAGVTSAFYRGSVSLAASQVLGFYDPDTGGLHMNGGDAAGTFAHELGHALDMSADRGQFDLSGSPEFLAAWRDEIRRTGNLSEYARTDEVEGFAEFCRLLYGAGPGGAAEAAGSFPRCYAFFQRHGLAPA